MSAPVPSLSGCVPCYNNDATLAAALASVRHQTIPVDDLIVVDDGSTDASCAVAEQFGARVVRQPRNLGRGAARALGVAEARHDLVLSVDATAELPPDFAARLAPWFDDARVAAVCTRIDDPNPQGLARRWRARHLFRTEAPVAVTRGASLITGGSLLRRSAVLAVGNFDRRCRQGEDAELGGRLLAAGYDVVFDPRVRVISTTANSMAQVLERHWRWNAGRGDALSWRAYLKDVSYSIRVMARHDLRAHDPAAVPISLFTPHYRAWRTWRLR
jgi:glycosyltransferase involved in cell wall biosynthesis